MAESVTFVFRPGLRVDCFTNVRLCGLWDDQGHPVSTQVELPMVAALDAAGCPSFQATVAFDDTVAGQTLRWGIQADGPGYADRWMIAAGAERDGMVYREFVLGLGNQTQAYDLTVGRRLGANVVPTSRGDTLRFSVFAPNAQSVELVLADPSVGYIADDGTGATDMYPMTRDTSGIWSTGSEPDLAEVGHLIGKPYMYRVTKDDGSHAYRSDLFSRAQIGEGGFDPGGKPYGGLPCRLDGTKSCSLVVDPERVIEDNGDAVPAATFWADEVNPAKPLPVRTQDLLIYELHVGALGFGRPEAGTLDDALAFVDYLEDLGVNAVELLPIAEFQGFEGWGYSTSHFAAIEGSAGGADRLKHFVRKCHRHGIAVLLDVVYNHYDGDAERAEWQYDSNDPARNICYWYEGQPSDYPSPDGGYVDNQSTGFAPLYSEEMVRQIFVSSAAAFVTDLHIDGFRVDQTTAIHSYAVLHADGRPADAAKIAGIAFLRQWTQTLRLIKPGLFLTAEDHSGWSAVTQPFEQGGLGFDAAWYSDFYHHLVDFGDGGMEWAKLLRSAGYGDGRPLAMSAFAGALRGSANGKVVYTDSHDEAGNSHNSARTICLAVNNAPLVGDTRTWAEARVRVAAGLALLSAGTPMFFMGEEVGAQQPYRYDDFIHHREDFAGLKAGAGKNLFAFYKDLIALSCGSPAIRSRAIDVFLADDVNRVIGFRRWSGDEQVLVVASLNSAPFDHGYVMHDDAFNGTHWREVLNSDATIYGGRGLGNFGATLPATGGVFNPVIPATGLLVFRQVAG